MKFLNFLKTNINGFTKTDFEYHYSILIKNINQQIESGKDVDPETSGFIVNLLLYRILYNFVTLLYRLIIFAVIFNLFCGTHLFYENNWINFGIAFVISYIRLGIFQSMLKLFYSNCNVKTTTN
jgi:hypothetical protein